MKPSYSEWAKYHISAVKREHRQWRKEKIGWSVILAMFVLGAAILFTGLQATI